MVIVIGPPHFDAESGYLPSLQHRYPASFARHLEVNTIYPEYRKTNAPSHTEATCLLDNPTASILPIMQ